MSINSGFWACVYVYIWPRDAFDVTAASPCREGMSEGMSEAYVGKVCRKGMSEGMSERYVSVVCRGYVGGHVGSLRQTGVPRGCQKGMSEGDVGRVGGTSR